MKRLLVLLALAGCDDNNNDPIECVEQDAGAPCCVPPFDLEQDGCPGDRQTLSVTSDALRCLTDDAHHGAFIEFDDDGKVTAYGNESPVGVLTTICDADGRVAGETTHPAGEVECAYYCDSPECGDIPLCTPCCDMAGQGAECPCPF